MVKTLTISQKLAAVRWAETNSVSVTARKFEIDPKRIREWKEKRQQLSNFFKIFNCSMLYLCTNRSLTFKTNEYTYNDSF